MGKQNKTIRNKRKIGIDDYQNNVVNSKKLNKKISKNISREMKLTVVSIFAVTIVMISSAYAIFSSVQKSSTYNTLTVGTLKIDFSDTDTGIGNVINLNGAYPESNDDGQAETPYSFKISNSGTLNAKYMIKILDDADMISSDGCQDNLLDKTKIRVSINGETPFTLSDTEANGYTIKNGTIATSEVKTFRIRIWISDTAGNEVLGKHYHGKILVETENATPNKNIEKVYTYNPTTTDNNYCVTGEETTCEETSCYKSNDIDSCKAGTIVKYNVDGTNTKYFYVLHDDGGKLTLQQRENIIYNTKWNTTNDNVQGPITILPKLEEATSSWTNVNDLNYTMGETIFKDNYFTGCNYDKTTFVVSCTANVYTLPSRTAKARMITAQEATNVGCKQGVENTCPIWMHNYLQKSTEFGGTNNDGTASSNNGYYTMSGDTSYQTVVLDIYYDGMLSGNGVTDPYYGARAVVEINK